MELLLSGDAAGYLKAAALGDRLCVFVHVPKTAGTSLRTEIAAILQPDVNIVVDYEDTSRSFHERIDDAVASFIADAMTRNVRFASGHILAHHVARIRAARPDTSFVTFLRNPVDRLISDYRYQRSTRHPVHAEFIANVPNLDAYLEIRSERNKMAQHLIPAEILLHGDPDECINYVLRTYDFVGIQEMYPISFRTLTTLVGTPTWPRVRENVNSENEDERNISPELAQRIWLLNPIDTALFSYFSTGLARVRDQLSQALAG